MLILVLLGASSLARELVWYMLKDRDCKHDSFVLVDDTTDAKTHLDFKSNGFILRVPIIKDWKFDKQYEFIVATGNPQTNRQMVEKALKAGLVPANTIIHPDAKAYGDDNKFGKGGFIAPGTIITTNATIGDYVIVNLNCTIGHDSILEDYVTFNPGVNCSGYVTIKNSTVLGTNVSIRDGVSVGARNIIGAQSAVVKNIDEEDGIYGGVPAKLIKRK